jgi:hypothetical protein
MAEELELTHEEISKMGVINAGFMGATEKSEVTEEVKGEVKEEAKEPVKEEPKAGEAVKEETKEPIKEPVKAEPKKLFSDAFKKKALEEQINKAGEAVANAKEEELRLRVSQLEGKIALDEKLKAEQEVINEAKTAMGDEWSPELEAEVAELIGSEDYDMLDKAGYNANKKMLILIDTAKQIVGENTNKAVKEKIKEIKDVSTINIKGDAEPKIRTKADVEADYKRTGDEKYMDEMLSMDMDGNDIKRFMGLSQG